MCVCVCVCVCVRALKGKRLTSINTKVGNDAVATASRSEEMMSQGQMSRSRGYEKKYHDSPTLLVKYVAAAGVGVHVDWTARF